MSIDGRESLIRTLIGDHHAACGSSQVSLSKSVSQLVVATIAGQLLFFIASPSLVERYGAEGFGLFALSYAVVSIGGTLAALKIEALIVAAKDQALAEELTAASLVCAFLVACAGFGLWKLGLSPLIKSAAVMADIEWVTFLATVLQAWVSVLSALATRQSLFGHLAINKFLAFGVIAISGLYLPVDFYVNSLVFSILISAALQLLILGIPLARQLLNFSFTKYRRDTILEIKSAVSLLFPATALDVVSQQLPILIISSTFGPTILGMYALAARIIYAPFSSISSAVSTVFMGNFSRTDNEQRRSLLIKTWKKLALMGAAIYIPVMVFGPALFGLVYGPGWEMAGQMARALALVVFINMIFSPTSVSFIVMGLRIVPVVAAASAFSYRIAAFAIGVLADSILVALYLFCLFEIIQIFMTNRILLKNLK